MNVGSGDCKYERYVFASWFYKTISIRSAGKMKHFWKWPVLLSNLLTRLVFVKRSFTCFFFSLLFGNGQTKSWMIVGGVSSSKKIFFEVPSQGGVLGFLNSKFLTWIHLPKISFLLFKSVLGSWSAIASFSLVQS